MSLVIFKNNFPTKKNRVVFIDADSFIYYETMNKVIQHFSMNRQICILSTKQDYKELMDALITLNMFATVIIFTNTEFINKSLMNDILPNYNPIGSVFIGNLNNEINYTITSSIGLKYNSIIHSGLFEN